MLCFNCGIIGAFGGVVVMPVNVFTCGYCRERTRREAYGVPDPTLLLAALHCIGFPLATVRVVGSVFVLFPALESIEICKKTSAANGMEDKARIIFIKS